MFRKNKYVIICYSIPHTILFIRYLYLYHNGEPFLNRTTVTVLLWGAPCRRIFYPYVNTILCQYIYYDLFDIK